MQKRCALRAPRMASKSARLTPRFCYEKLLVESLKRRVVRVTVEHTGVLHCDFRRVAF